MIALPKQNFNCVRGEGGGHLETPGLLIHDLGGLVK